MNKKSIGIIIAHPDDEILGFGGVILKYAEEGLKISILFLSTGLSSRNNNVKEEEILVLRNTAKSVSKKLGVTKVIFENFPDNQMDTVPFLSVVKKIEDFIMTNEIDTIFTHYDNDLNIDHNIVSRAVLTAARPLPKSKIKRIYFGETLSSTEYAFHKNRFQPNTYFDISKYLEKKLSILNLYKEEFYKNEMFVVIVYYRFF